MKSLLNTHQSIYDALNHPELDKSITPESSPSFTEWQELSKIPSVISISDEEEEEETSLETLNCSRATIITQVEMDKHLIDKLKSLVIDVNPPIVKTDLIFVINDGAPIQLDIGNHKIIIINMIHTDYFGNLFKLINQSPPLQIWKVSHLDEMIPKMRAFFEINNCTILQPDPLNLDTYFKTFLSFCLGMCFGLTIGIKCFQKQPPQENLLLDLSNKLIQSIKSGLEKLIL